MAITLTAGAARSASPPHAIAGSRTVERLAAPGLGVLATGVSLIGAGTPSFWGDEAATVMSAQRPLPSLLLELSRIDAVHGLYYLLMHGWIRIFGAGELSVRVPSALAAGLAVAGVVLLGRALLGRMTGVLAGAVLAVLPEFTKLAIEARSYEFGVAAATWLTLLLVVLLRRRSRRLWILYAAGTAAAIWLWVFFGLLLIVHVALLVELRARRAAWVSWTRSAIGIAIVCAPIAAVTFAQRGQVAFLAARGYATPAHVLIGQWFEKPLVAVVAWALLAAGAVTALRLPRHRRRRAAALAVWAFAPTLLILGVTALVTPIYNERYLAFSLPAVALGIALGLTGVWRRLSGSRPLAGAAIALVAATLVASIAPGFGAQRSPFGKNGADVRQAGDVLRAHASTGDAVVYDRTVKPSQRPRVIAHLYPGDVAGLDDVALKTAYDRRAGIWDTTYPLAEIASRLADHPVVWALEVRGSGSPDLAELQRLGYAVTATYPVHRTVVYRLDKETP